MTYSQFKKFQKLNTTMKLINAFIVGSLARNSRSYGSHSADWCRGCRLVQRMQIGAEDVVQYRVEDRASSSPLDISDSC